MSIIITADSSCDLSKDYLSPLPFEVIPLSIIQEGKAYQDGLEITPEDIYTRVANGADVPTTSAINVADYSTRFEALLKTYEAIIHINIGSEISSCHANAKIAAEELPNVYLVDSGNISVGQGILVLEAKRMVEEGVLSPSEIANELIDLASRVEFTFVLDQVTYLHKGGRCSNIAALGANLLKLKPVIAVLDGKLVMVKKYRGVFEKVLPSFFQDLLKDRDDIEQDKTMLVTTKCPDHWIDAAVSEIRTHGNKEITDLFYAGCTICSHSGPKALGLAIVRKKKV